MNQNIKSKNNIIFIVMIVLSISIILGTGAYAYYQTNINGITSGTIAKWDFKANGQSETFTINVDEIYPGKSGTYNIELSAENSDLDVYYELLFDNYDFQRLFFWDSSYTIPIDVCEKAGKYGTIPAGQKITIPLYFYWPYDGVDHFYNDGNVSNQIVIVGQQLNGYNGNTPLELLADEHYLYGYKNGYFKHECEE